MFAAGNCLPRSELATLRGILPLDPCTYYRPASTGILHEKPLQNQSQLQFDSPFQQKYRGSRRKIEKTLGTCKLLKVIASRVSYTKISTKQDFFRVRHLRYHGWDTPSFARRLKVNLFALDASIVQRAACK